MAQKMCTSPGCLPRAIVDRPCLALAKPGLGTWHQVTNVGGGSSPLTISELAPRQGRCFRRTGTLTSLSP